jgi:hypothetical protein
MTPEDLWIYKRLSALGEKLTGYPAISIYHDFKYHPKEVITGTQDWLYEHLGSLFWTVEIWAPNKEAGITEVRLDPLVPRASGGRRPQAAEVERRAVRRQRPCHLVPVPPPAAGHDRAGRLGSTELLAQPAAASARARAGAVSGLARHAGVVAARLEVLRTEVRALGVDTWRVRFAVANAGYLPSHISRRALERKTARGVVFEVHLPPGVTLLSGKQREIGPQLDGHAHKNSLQAFLPQREITADRAVVEWVVCAPRGTHLALTASADRAGTVRTEVTLD